MRIPQKITVPGDDEESRSTAARDGMGSMSIPERIEIGTFSPKNSDIPRELRDEVVHVNSMSSMITPPRTLTVDDTKSAYYPQRAAAGSPSVVAQKDRRANIARDIEDESIAVGLEVIEEGTPLDSDSDVGHYVGNDMSDTRKCVLQIQQLNRRVRDLERDVDRNSVGFWSKMAFFAFTIINPIILQWLFWKRR
ncbi:uncharacterized protein LOC144665390 [Oculina patagonica]